MSQKWLKIDGYMQRGILQALNPLSNRVTFTAIVPGQIVVFNLFYRYVIMLCEMEWLDMRFNASKSCLIRWGSDIIDQLHLSYLVAQLWE